MSVSYSGSARAARRMSWFLLFLVGVALTVTLYFVKTHAQSAKRDVRDLTKAIATEQAAIDETWPGRVDVTDLFDYPTVTELAAFLEPELSSA